MKQFYFLQRRGIASDDLDFDNWLALAYDAGERPHCLCRTDVELRLYISLRHGGHVLARMPDTGPDHAPWCDHYDAPDHLTGLGHVLGSAVVEDKDGGEITLKFGFPLTRGAARAAPTAFSNEKPPVKSAGIRLTLRSLLHFLWDRGELTHWRPRMAHKRNWYIVRRELVSTATSCRVKGDSLEHVLFVPEPFNVEAKDEIVSRRMSQLTPVRASPDAIMVVVGEVKTLDPSRYGERLILKHLPDMPFFMDEDMARRFNRYYADELQLWRSHAQEDHLILAASFSINAKGMPQLYEIAVMPVAREWLPYETLDERALLAKAVEEKRIFVKGLRYNLNPSKPIASITLQDTGDTATAIHLARNLPDPEYDEELAELMRTPGLGHAMWSPGASLPAKTVNHPSHASAIAPATSG
jgi:hypothetical protein